jgi:anti-sigma B factor antagonist
VRRADKGLVRIEVEGELDLATAPELEETLGRELGAGNHVVLDLAAVTFIDSTGLHTILSALQACGKNGLSIS